MTRKRLVFLIVFIIMNIGLVLFYIYPMSDMISKVLVRIMIGGGIIVSCNFVLILLYIEENETDN
jgi:hypothetical protein